MNSNSKIPNKNTRIYMLKYGDIIVNPETFNSYLDTISQSCNIDFGSPNLTIWLINPTSYWNNYKWHTATGGMDNEHTYKGNISPNDIDGYNILENGGYSNLDINLRIKVRNFSLNKGIEQTDVHFHISCSHNDESIRTNGLMIGSNALLNKFHQYESDTNYNNNNNNNNNNMPPLATDMPSLPDFNGMEIEGQSSLINDNFWKSLNGGSKKCKSSKISKKKIYKNKKNKKITQNGSGDVNRGTLVYNSNNPNSENESENVKPNNFPVYAKVRRPRLVTTTNKPRLVVNTKTHQTLREARREAGMTEGMNRRAQSRRAFKGKDKKKGGSRINQKRVTKRSTYRRVNNKRRTHKRK